MKTNFTNDELNLMCIYNTGTRAGLMDALVAMREYLDPEETELRKLTDTVLKKLERVSDEEYATLELFQDFDK